MSAEYARQDRIVAVVGYFLCGGLAAGLGCLFTLGQRHFEWNSTESYIAFPCFALALVLFGIGTTLMLRAPKKPLRGPFTPLFIFGAVVGLPGFFILVEVVLGEHTIYSEIAWSGLGAFALGFTALAIIHVIARRRAKARVD